MPYAADDYAGHFLENKDHFGDFDLRETARHPIRRPIQPIGGWLYDAAFS